MTMRNVIFFMMTTLNGCYERGRWDVDPTALDWHTTDAEFEAFAAEQLGEADTILFGRVTYEGMATSWPTSEARAADPAVAEKRSGRSRACPTHRRSRTSGNYCTGPTSHAGRRAAVGVRLAAPPRDQALSAEDALRLALQQSGMA